MKVIALINDTVGTMVAAAHESGGECHVGVIIGELQIEYFHEFFLFTDFFNVIKLVNDLK